MDALGVFSQLIKINGISCASAFPIAPPAPMMVYGSIILVFANAGIHVLIIYRKERKERKLLI
ncbi:MAG: hypothetical protein H7246_06545 [Phycisphaerae bacterium]|nr:hypothetical protein [Saprospiraceae bacterium]